jgi:hypothetical protein
MISKDYEFLAIDLRINAEIFAFFGDFNLSKMARKLAFALPAICNLRGMFWFFSFETGQIRRFSKILIIFYAKLRIGRPPQRHFQINA